MSLSKCLKPQAIPWPAMPQNRPPFTIGIRQQVLGRFEIQNQQMIEDAQITEDDLETMADAILNGQTNGLQHYRQHGRSNQPVTTFQKVFARLADTLAPYLHPQVLNKKR